MKIISFQNYKHWYLIHTWSEKAFKGTVVIPGIAIFTCSVTWNYAYSPFKHKFYYIFATCCRRPVISLNYKTRLQVHTIRLQKYWDQQISVSCVWFSKLIFLIQNSSGKIFHKTWIVWNSKLNFARMCLLCTLMQL